MALDKVVKFFVDIYKAYKASETAQAIYTAFTIITAVVGVKGFLQARQMMSKGQDILANKTAAGGKIPVIYGTRRVGTQIVYMDTAQNRSRDLFVVYALAVGECDEIIPNSIEIDGNSIYDGNIYKGGGYVGSDRYGQTGYNNHRPLNTASQVGDNQYSSAGNLGTNPALRYSFVFNLHHGASSQTVDPMLSASIGSQWTTAHKLNGICYIAASFDYDKKGMYKGVPQITVQVRGKRVFDPRDNSTKWSSNPALCFLDYIQNDEYGKGLATSQINMTAIGTAADKCDTLVDQPYYNGSYQSFTWSGDTGNDYILINDNDDWWQNKIDEVVDIKDSDGNLVIDEKDIKDSSRYEFYDQTQENRLYIDDTLQEDYTNEAGTIRGRTKRFHCNGYIDTNKNVMDNAKELLANMRGIFTYIDGKYELQIEDTGTSTFSITDDHIIGDAGISVDYGNKDKRANKVVIEFFNANKKYELDTATVLHDASPEYYSDDGEILEVKAEFPYVTDPYIAYNMGKAILTRSRNQTTMQFLGTPEMYKLNVGDIVDLTYLPLNFNAKICRVEALELQANGLVAVSLIEYFDVYTWEVPAQEPTTIIAKPPTIGAIHPPEANSIVFTDTDDSAINRPTLTWTEPTDFPVKEFRVDVEDTSNTPVQVFSKLVNTNSVDLSFLPVGNYNAIITSINGVGIESADVTKAFTIGDPPTATADIQDDAVVTDKITDDAITTPKILDNAVTDAKINSLTANKITAGTIDASVITVTNLDADNITSGSIGADKITVDDLSAINSDLGDIDAGSLNIGSGAFVVTTAGAMTATSADVVGDLKTGNLVVTGDAGIHGEVRATSITAETVTVESIKQEVWNEIDRRTAPAQNGFYDDFSSTGADGYYVGVAKNFDLLGTNDNGYQINSKDIDLRAGMVTGFATSTNYTGTALEATFQYFYKLASDSTWTALTPTYVGTTDKYTTPDGYFYELDADPSHRINSGTLTAESYYHFRLRVTPTVTNNVWTDSDAGSGYKVEYGIQQSSTGTGTGTGTVTSVSGGDGITASPSSITTTGSLAVDSTVVRTSGVQTLGGNKTFSDNVVIQGNLDVQGTTTTIDTANLDVKDKNITLNYGTGDTSANANGAGITIQDAVSATQDATLTWNTANDSFNFSHPLNVTGGIGSGAITSTSSITASSGGNATQLGIDGNIEITRTSGGAYIDFKDSTSEDFDQRIQATSTGHSFSGTINSGAIDVTGTVTFDGGTTSANLNFGDGDKAVFGNSSDLQIYHDGLHSFVKDAGTGNLKILADNLLLQRADQSQTYIQALTGGAVDLRYAGEAKLATTSSGINVTGTTVTDGLTVDGETFSSNGTYGTKLTYSNGNQSGVIDTFGNHNLEFRANNDRAMNIASNGDISFYEDTGTTQAFFWDASAENLGLGDTAPQDYLEINGSGRGLGGLTISNSSASHAALSFARSSTATARIKTSEPAALHTSALHFQTSDASGGSPNLLTAMYIDENQRVGIGTDDPERPLHIASATPYIVFDETDTSQKFSMGSGGGKFFLYDETDSAQRLTVDTSGKVGIGASSPDGNLEVVASSVIDSTSDTVNNVLIGLQSANRPTIVLDTADTTYTNRSWNITNVGAVGSLVIGRHGLDVLNLKNDGKVGIGTSLPSHLLSVGTEGNSSGKKISLYLGGTNGNYSAIGAQRAENNTYCQSEIRFINENNSSGLGAFAIATGNNNLTERLRIDSSGGVGIGTTNPQAALHVAGGFNATAPTGNGVMMGYYSNSYGYIQLNGTSGGYIDFSTSGTDHKGRILYDNTDNYLRLDSNGSERMRLDSSGNLLVGTTDTSVWNNGAGGNTGTVIESDGTIQLAKSNNITAYFNRLDSDGEILSFRKNGAGVGSIGTLAGDLLVGTGNTGLLFYDADPQIIPRNPVTGANVDATVDLGASGSRFKDLHLSGTGYFGTNIAINAGNKIQLSGATDSTHHIYHDSSTDYDVVNYSTGFQLEHHASGTQFTLVGATGNVGIGTGAPNTNLHIYDGSGGATLKIESNLANAYDSSRIQLLGGNLSTSEILLGDASSATVGRIIYRHNGNSLAFDVNSSERMRIDSSGNIGIGTSSPSSYYAKNLVVSAPNEGGMTMVASATTANNYILFADGTTGDAAYRGQLAYNHNEDALNLISSGYLTLRSGSSRLERIRIDSSGRVGIGTTSPEEKLQLLSSGNTLIRVTSGTSSIAGIDFGDNADTDVGRIRYLNSSNALQFSTQATERMRIDSTGKLFLNSTSVTAGYTGAHLIVGGQTSPLIKLQSTHGAGSAWDMYATSGTSLIFARNQSDKVAITSAGNLLVGKISTSFSTDGVEIKNDQIWSTNTSSDCISLNRKTTDGAMATFYKDGSTIGSIGVINTNNLTIGGSVSNHSGLQFGTAVITPMRANSESDAQIDIGFSNARFKDLYLSGAINSGAINTTGITVDSRLVIDGASIYDNSTNGNNKGFRIGGQGLVPLNGSGTDTNNIVDIGTATYKFKDLYLSGTINSGAITCTPRIDINASGTADTRIEVGAGTTTNHYAYIDLISDTTYTDYGLRILRDNTGANASSSIYHRGTGNFNIIANESASIRFNTNGSNALTLDASQNATFAGNIIKSGGTDAQFLKADGSVQSTSASSPQGTLTPFNEPSEEITFLINVSHLDGLITGSQTATLDLSTGEIEITSQGELNIKANSIEADKIASNTITANEIASGTITASEIASSTITGDKINVDTLNVKSFDNVSSTIVSHITAGTKFPLARDGQAYVQRSGTYTGSNASFVPVTITQVRDNAGYVAIFSGVLGNVSGGRVQYSLNNSTWVNANGNTNIYWNAGTYRGYTYVYTGQITTLSSSQSTVYWRVYFSGSYNHTQLSLNVMMDNTR